jgi:putative tricarboxylic transport membrane protein
MIKFGFATAPFLIAFILSPIGEKALRSALLMSDGSLSIFVTRPISLFFVILTLLSIIGIIRGKRKKPVSSQGKKGEVEGQTNYVAAKNN